jgi:hypothetical protein
VRVVEPGLSPHSACRQRDVRCRLDFKNQKARESFRELFARDLDGLLTGLFAGSAAHQIGEITARYSCYHAEQVRCQLSSCQIPAQNCDLGAFDGSDCPLADVRGVLQ